MNSADPRQPFRARTDRPYVILGVSYVAGEDEIKQTYRRLVRENHPDSLMARGVPEEFMKLANDKLRRSTPPTKPFKKNDLQGIPDRCKPS